MFLNSSINPFSFAKRINRPLILDGAMGSLLQQHKIEIRGSMWMTFANINNPEVVIDIHKKYIEAGADIITTNTFRTNPSSVQDNANINELVKKSVALAREVVSGYPVFIAGSNAPAEDCYQRKRTLTRKELEYNHHMHIDQLVSNGCDFILNETQSHLDEIKIICGYSSKKEIPYVLSIYTDENLRLLDNGNLDDTLNLISDFNPLAVSINCISQNILVKTLPIISKYKNWGSYINCGAGLPADEFIECGISPESFGDISKEVLKYKPSFIGACCGSNPDHTKELRKVINGFNRN